MKILKGSYTKDVVYVFSFLFSSAAWPFVRCTMLLHRYIELQKNNTRQSNESQDSCEELQKNLSWVAKELQTNFTLTRRVAEDSHLKNVVQKICNWFAKNRWCPPRTSVYISVNFDKTQPPHLMAICVWCTTPQKGLFQTKIKCFGKLIFILHKIQQNVHVIHHWSRVFWLLKLSFFFLVIPKMKSNYLNCWMVSFLVENN